MTPDIIASLTQQALLLTLWLTFPIVLTAALIGLAWGFFQALTQINDQTTSYALKLIGLTIVVGVGAGWGSAQLKTYGETLFGQLASVRR